MIFRSLLSLLIGFAALAQTASALEFSMVSGLYRSEKSKLDGDNAGGESTIDVGARVAGPIDLRLHWFGEGAITLRSYEDGKNFKAPDNSTSLRLGGGVRYYFSRFSEFAVPFVYASGHYRNDKKATYDALQTTETEVSGLYYGAATGIRLGLDKDFFLDFETPLFDSALFATEISETTPATGPKSKRTKSHTELYVNTTGALSSVAVALGLKI